MEMRFDKFDRYKTISRNENDTELLSSGSFINGFWIRNEMFLFCILLSVSVYIFYNRRPI